MLDAAARRGRRPPGSPGCVDVTTDLAALDSTGFWAVVLPFDGAPVCARFDRRAPGPALARPRRGSGPPPDVVDVEPRPSRVPSGRRGHPRRPSRAGDVYQVNLHPACCRAPLPPRTPTSPRSAPRWPRATPRRTPRSCACPTHGVHVASASPERFLRRDGPRSWSSPDQGHGRDRRRLPRQGPGRERDDRRPRAQRPRPGVRVRLGARARAAARSRPTPGCSTWCRTVDGPAARRASGWAELIDATFPPGSVTGAPKLAALDAHRPARAGRRAASYCGAVGWVDADRRRGRAQRRHPHVLVRRRPAALRHRRRHHVGLDARRRVGGDRAQGPPPARSRRRSAAWASCVDDRVDRRRAGRRRRGRACRRSTTGSPSATACSRRCKVVRRRAVRGAPPPRAPGAARRRASASSLPPTRRCCAPRSTRSIGRQRPGRRPPADHGHRRRRPARLGRGATGPPTVHRRGAPRRPPGRPPTDVVTVPWPRNERGALAGLKTTSYAENVVALDTRRERGRRRGDLRQHWRATCARAPAPTCSSSSAAGSCTPPLSSGCLAGVTRELVLELDRRDRGRRAARPLWPAPTRRSSRRRTRDVQPIAPIDGRVLPAAPGPAHDGRGRRLRRARRPRRSIPDRSAARCTTSPTATTRSPSPVSTTRWPSSVDVDGGAARTSRSAARPARRGRASRSAGGSRVRDPSSSAGVARRRAARAARASRRSRSTVATGDVVGGDRDAASSAGSSSGQLTLRPMPTTTASRHAALERRPRRGCRPACDPSPTTRSLGHLSRARTPATSAHASAAASATAIVTRCSRGRVERGPQQHRHQQRRARRRLPRAAQPAPAGGLVVGDQRRRPRARPRPRQRRHASRLVESSVREWRADVPDLACPS